MCINFDFESSGYEACIGVETHVQLCTNSKIFCKCENIFNAPANSNICEICCGYPGVLPVLNEKVVEFAIMAAIATNCKINNWSKFDRKHYFYADLPKGYQITQNDIPYCNDGFVNIKLKDGSMKKIRIQRIHIEEDTGRNIHSDYGSSLVDFNRCGTPLLEIVTHPDISSPNELSLYLKELHSILTNIQITTGDMEKGSFRADANISVRKVGDSKLGTKCELKNINSFKFISDAAEYEINRQVTLIESGGEVRQQTRLWDTKNKKTYVMREKEGADDYRYFVEPDLPCLKIDPEWIERIKAVMPKSRNEKIARMIEKYNVAEYEAVILVDDETNAGKYFENAALICDKIKSLLSWILRDLMAKVRSKKSDFMNIPFTPNYLVDLVMLIENKYITQKIAKDVFDKCYEFGEKPSEYVERNNLKVKEFPKEEIERILVSIIGANKDVFERYKSGNDRLKGFFMGQLMAKTKGAVNPMIAQKIFDEIINKKKL
jgi:aspartyl-tRNA(Asn)/glutamyl-tRNA(Gln) amidotransferase subunit B